MAQFLSSMAWHYLGQRSLQGMAIIVPSERFTRKVYKDGKTDGLTERRRQLSDKGWERLGMSCAPWKTRARESERFPPRRLLLGKREAGLSLHFDLQEVGSSLDLKSVELNVEIEFWTTDFFSLGLKKLSFFCDHGGIFTQPEKLPN